MNPSGFWPLFGLLPAGGMLFPDGFVVGWQATTGGVVSTHRFSTTSVSVAPVGVASVTLAVIESTPRLAGAIGTVYENVTTPAAFVMHDAGTQTPVAPAF